MIFYKMGSRLFTNRGVSAETAGGLAPGYSERAWGENGRINYNVGYMTGLTKGKCD